MKKPLLLICLITATNLFAQDADKNATTLAEENYNYIIPISTKSVKGTYPLFVSDINTVHIIFPSKVMEIDAGNGKVLIQITESFNNVIRVKSLTEDMQPTNLTVMTENGGFYSFALNYKSYPDVLNIKIDNNIATDKAFSTSYDIDQVVKNNLILSQPLVNYADLKAFATSAAERKPYLKNIGVQNLGIQATLSAISSAKGLMFYTINIDNKSDLDFTADFVKMYIKDADNIKKQAIQEEELTITETFPNVMTIVSGSDLNTVLVTPFRTISEDKVIAIEIYEKNGGRHLRFPIVPTTLSKTKAL
jgi:conjugative transposon TraN protein